ncbi:unnamed protein product [Coffea canephora]|uniref:Cyanobacterial aminoacyl-tRNA synthetase CAAD domain-containing protein n=1 Tax=Coffea canephora TaxID=49390 RepID=A0A068UMB4_COFCA|nr:unnamed protein product [Coffea canephora]
MAAAAAAASTSMAATAVSTSRFPVRWTTSCSAFPYLPPRLSTSTAFSTSFKKLSVSRILKLDCQKCNVETRIILTLNCERKIYEPYLFPQDEDFLSNLHIESRSTLLQVKASEESPAVDTTELLSDLKEKWDAVENKSTVIVYGGGAIVGVWLASIIIGAINSVPLLPKILELVGLGYTGWFVYRYLLFKSSRKELAEDIESLKKKIAGTE